MKSYILLPLLAPAALGQGHGNGLAKSTYAISSDELARESLHWLIKVLRDLQRLGVTFRPHQGAGMPEFRGFRASLPECRNCRNLSRNLEQPGHATNRRHTRPSPARARAATLKVNDSDSL